MNYSEIDCNVTITGDRQTVEWVFCYDFQLKHDSRFVFIKTYFHGLSFGDVICVLPDLSGSIQLYYQTELLNSYRLLLLIRLGLIQDIINTICTEYIYIHIYIY